MRGTKLVKNMIGQIEKERKRDLPRRKIGERQILGRYLSLKTNSDFNACGARYQIP